MDIPICTESVYSEDYINLFLKLDNDMTFENNRINPECVTMFTNRYGVAYKNAASYNFDELLYYNIPKCYGLSDDSAVRDTGADVLFSLPGIGVTGEGVLIGFVDTGIDYLSPAFRNIRGSRIAYMWDQNEAAYGYGDTVFGYGAEFDRDKINEAINSDNPYSIVPSKDEIGHGSILASVAAGGVDVENNFRGMAPNSELLVVKLKPAKKNLKDFYFISPNANCYGEDDIILGIRYLIDKAAIFGKPLVICLGIGSSQGNHNGSTSLEIFLGELSNIRGLCAVAAVGNELGFGGHYQSNQNILELDGRERVEIVVDNDCEGFTVELWGRPPGLIMTSVISPTGERFSNIPYSQDGSANKRFLYEGTTVYATNFVVEDITGDQLIIFRFEKPTEGMWIIEATEYSKGLSTGFDVWLPINEFLDTGIRFARPEPNITLCSPATGAGTIAVAGYNHVNNAIYFRSGRGYTRSFKIKPDITAPAVDVQGVFATTSNSLLYTRTTGTSVAAAITSGAAALLFDWGIVQGFYPILTTEIVRQLFIRGTKYVNDMTYPNRMWGYGVLDLVNTFEMIRGN